MRLAFTLIALFFCHPAFTQVKSIKLNVNLEKIETNDKVIIATVHVEKNGDTIHKKVLQNGVFNFKLETDAVYKIYFSKINHATKHLLIDTRYLPENTKKRQKLRVTMTYFIEPEEIDMSFLENTPVGIARYDEQYGKLRWDYEYAFLINKKIGKLLYDIKPE